MKVKFIGGLLDGKVLDFDGDTYYHPYGFPETPVVDYGQEYPKLKKIFCQVYERKMTRINGIWDKRMYVSRSSYL